MELEQLVLTVFQWVAGFGAGLFVLIGMVDDLRQEFQRVQAKRGERW